MSHNTFATFEIDGRRFEIAVDTTDGEFLTRYGGDWIRAASYKALQEKLRKMVRAEGKIEIHATVIDDAHEDAPTVVPIVITGRHAGNRNLLYREVKTGDTNQLRWGKVYRKLEGKEIAEFFDLVRARKAAVEAIEEWLETRELDTHAALDAAHAAIQAQQPVETK